MKKKIIICSLVFFGSFVFFMACFYFYIRLDLILNPWIEKVLNDIKFGNSHYLTVLYLKNGPWFIISLLFSLFFSIYNAFMVYKKVL